MNKIILVAITLSLLSIGSRAIAQTSRFQVSPSAQNENVLFPTEDAGSEDLVTQPAESNSSTLDGVVQAEQTDQLEDLSYQAPDIILVEGADFRESGPANADHVQFVFD